MVYYIFVVFREQATIWAAYMKERVFESWAEKFLNIVVYKILNFIILNWIQQKQIVQNAELYQDRWKFVEVLWIYWPKS